MRWGETPNLTITSNQIHVLCLALILLVLLGLQGLVDFTTTEMVRRARVMFAESDRIAATVSNVTSSLSTRNEQNSSQQSRLEQLRHSSKEIQSELGQLQDDKRVLNETIVELGIQKTRLDWFFRAAQISLFLSLLYSLFTGRRAVVRARFAQDMSRFMWRIQGLATKEQLRSLVKAELSVKDEQTLTAYLTEVKALADSHGVLLGSLARSLKGWSDTIFPASEPASSTSGPTPGPE